MGRDSIIPFIDDTRFGAFVLCLTSNSGSSDLQKKMINDSPMYLSVLDMLKELRQDNIGIVVGATQEDEMRKIRSEAPLMPWLIPGIGKQGGDLEKSMLYGNNNGISIINISRSIIFPSDLSEKSIRNEAKNYLLKMRAILDD